MLSRMEGPKDKPGMDSEPGKARWLAKGNPEDVPYKSDSALVRACLFEPARVSVHVHSFFS